MLQCALQTHIANLNILLDFI